MTEITDAQLGTITVRRNQNSRGIKFRIAPNGGLTATCPPGTPISLIKLTIKSNKKRLLSLLFEHRSKNTYTNGQQIGKSHVLEFTYGSVATPSATTKNRQITVIIPPDMTTIDPDAQAAARKAVVVALRKEAKLYLSRRLHRLADRYGFSVSTVRYTHSTGRWGSCSSTGTISLNIALMMLPLDIIDYILIHELCHTRHMNHSTDFWAEVGAILPTYKKLRTLARDYSPSV